MTAISAILVNGQDVSMNDLRTYLQGLKDGAGSFISMLTGYGAVADARQVVNAAMTSGSAVLTSTGAAFVAGDVGKSITVGGAGASGQKLRTTILSRQSATQITLAAAASTTVSSAGATFGTDCGAALQSALTALANAGGGTLVIDGSFYLGTAVSSNLGSLASLVNILGMGSNSRIYICCADADDAIVFSNAQHLINIEGVTFIGTVKAKNDARKVIKFDQCWAAKVENCGFYALGVIDAGADGAVIWSESTRYAGIGNFFGGCAAAAGLNTPLVKHYDWFGGHHEREQYIDYGQLGTITYSKTPDGGPLAWIFFGAPNADASPASQDTIRVHQCRFDEGATSSVQVATGGPSIWRVHITDCESNASDAGGFGFSLSNVDEAVIERCSVGYADAGTTDFGTFTSCGHVLISRCRGWASVTRITANTVTTLELKNVTGITSLALTSVTNFKPGDPPFVKAGVISDADFLAPPMVGFWGFDTTNNKIMVRDTAGWLSTVALT